MYPDLALVARKESGKSTVARILSEEFGYTEMGLADPIREIMHTMNPLVGWLDGLEIRYRDAIAAYGYTEAKKAVPEIRRLMQLHGEASRRTLGVDVFCEALYCERDLPNGPVVISDMRFLNEHKFLTYRDFVSVRVVNPNADTSDTDISETESDLVPSSYVIHNDGHDIEKLRAAVRELVSTLGA